MILPHWLTEVAQSITNGKVSDDSMPKVRGLVPIIGSTPKARAIYGRALVPVSLILKRAVEMKG